MFEVYGARVCETFVYNSFVAASTQGTRALDEIANLYVPQGLTTGLAQIDPLDWVAYCKQHIVGSDCE